MMRSEVVYALPQSLIIDGRSVYLFMFNLFCQFFAKPLKAETSRTVSFDPMRPADKKDVIFWLVFGANIVCADSVCFFSLESEIFSRLGSGAFLVATRCSGIVTMSPGNIKSGFWRTSPLGLRTLYSLCARGFSETFFAIPQRVSPFATVISSANAVVPAVKVNSSNTNKLAKNLQFFI